MHASACESLLPFLNPGSKVLDIGSGSGYLTHVIAELVKPGGTVIGIDHIQALVDMAEKNMRKSTEGTQLLEDGTVKFVKGDGRKGYPDGGPYDAIHVGAAAAEHHQDLVDQLKSPGRYAYSKKDVEKLSEGLTITADSLSPLRRASCSTSMLSIKTKTEKSPARRCMGCSTCL